MYHIQKLNKISRKGLQIFDTDDYEVASQIIDPHGILVRSAKMHDMELPQSLMAIARAGAGVNNIPVDTCTTRGIPVFNTPGSNANGVKELVVAGLLLSSRDIIGGIEWAKTLVGNGDQVPKMVEKGKSAFAGNEIAGKTLGVVGLGAIGVLVANAATDLGMQVLGYDPFISVEAAWGLSRSVKREKTLENLLSQCDYISLHIPLTEKTKGVINNTKFSVMEKGTVLLNFARGGLVNNKDLLEAIEQGTIARYVTDFPDEDLLRNERVIGIPHLGASTTEAEDNSAIMAATQLKDYLENGNIINSVNFPACKLEVSGPTRILIATENIPNMVGQITAILGEAHINIEDMLNKHRDSIAYNIIDVTGDVPEEVVEKLRAIKGCIMVRMLHDMM
jgi:D-3-phosphoglycerate dehydrogenase